VALCFSQMGSGGEIVARPNVSSNTLRGFALQDANALGGIPANLRHANPNRNSCTSAGDLIDGQPVSRDSIRSCDSTYVAPISTINQM